MRFLVTGASGLLGAELVRQLRSAGETVCAWSGSTIGTVAGVTLRPLDLACPAAMAGAFCADRPDVVLHAAALARVGDCYARPEQARQVNAEGSHVLAELSAAAGARLVLVSTDLVFDGTRGNYRETATASPLSVYGRSKLAAEQAVLAIPHTAVARVSLLVGAAPFGRASFFVEQVRSLRQGRQVSQFADEWRSPLAVATASAGLIALARGGFTGLIHLGGPERLSRLEMGQKLAQMVGADPDLAVPTQRAAAPLAEPRPRDVSLDSSLWRSLFPDVPWPAWEKAIDWRGV